MSRFLVPALHDLQAYVPGEQPGGRQYIKLNANEAPFPPSPLLKQRIGAAELEKLNLYPDANGTAAKKKLAALEGLLPENICLANGSDEALMFAFLAFCDSERAAVLPDITYSFYQVQAKLFGVPLRQIPLAADFSLQAKDYFNAGGTIFIPNPNAPSGMMISLQQIESILAANAENVVIIDEAYVYFGCPSAAPLIAKYPNLLVVRTLSKSASLAGMRFGYALGNAELIADLERVRNSINPYNLDRLALLAGETFADDEEYYRANCTKICATRESTTAALREMGFFCTQSRANFIFSSHPQAKAEDLLLGLRERGILVRHFNQPPIENYLRISVGRQEDMQLLLQAIREILAAR